MANSRPYLRHVFTSEVIEQMATTPPPGRDKGSRGRANEVIQGIPQSSALIDGMDFEAKTTTIGQDIRVTQLKHCLEDIIENSVEFDDSKVGTKLDQVWYTVYERKEKGGQMLGNAVFGSEAEPEHHRQLQEDYGFLSAYIKSCYLNNVEVKTRSGPNRLLKVSTSAAPLKSGDYTPLRYKETRLRDKGMAFYICGRFSREMFS